MLAFPPQSQVPHILSLLPTKPIFQHCYNEFSLVYRIWVNLHLLKRGGAVHHPGGVESLLEGSMAVECPACPQPGRNVDAESLAKE